jgi:fructose-specific component phosphotransferase system IIB-like protein
MVLGRRIVGSGRAAFLLRRMLTRAGRKANRRMVNTLIQKEHPNQKHAYCRPSVRI